MYQINSKNIPQSQKAIFNSEILSNINNFTQQEVYNTYTGIGGLHGLKQSDYANYNEYAKAKREIEQGQFFTPHHICKMMVDMLSVQPTDMVMDICCGMGNFINFLPNKHNAYGYDIDPNAIKVAQYLYPNANLQIANLMTHCGEEGYYGDKYPNKAKQIERMLRHQIKGKVAIGCTSREAVELYKSFLKEKFPDRELFVINGDVQFKSRQRVLDKFEKTDDGILVCTQQSLKSSANVPTCEDVILESLQWNIPRMEQFYFRFIRLDSIGKRRVYFLTYENSIEQNLMTLLLTKERLNEFIKAGEVKQESEIFEEYDIDPSIIGSLFTKEKDEHGRFQINWGCQRIEE